jgi:hypothetical protein
MRNLSKPAKLVLGVLSVIPLVYIVFFIGVVGMSAGNPGGGILGGPGGFALLFMAHAGVMLLIMGQMLLYVVDALTRNPSFTDGTQRAIWALILFMGNMLAVPVYFGLHVWPDPPPEHPS